MSYRAICLQLETKNVYLTMEQAYTVKTLEHAIDHIQMSADFLKGFNGAVDTPKAMKTYLKMSLLLLERAEKSIDEMITHLDNPLDSGL